MVHCSRSLLICLTCLLLGGCQLTPSRALTGFRDQERLRVKLEREKDQPRDPLDSKLALEPLTAAILAPVAAWLVGELVGLVEKAFAEEQRQHLGAYTTRL